MTLCLGCPWYVQQASPASLSLSCAHSGAGSFCDGTKRVTLQAPERSPTDTTPPGGREAEPGQLRMREGSRAGPAARGPERAPGRRGSRLDVSRPLRPLMIESYQQSRRINGSRPRGRFLLWEENISHAGQPERRLLDGALCWGQPWGALGGGPLACLSEAGKPRSSEIKIVFVASRFLSVIVPLLPPG